MELSNNSPEFYNPSEAFKISAIKEKGKRKRQFLPGIKYFHPSDIQKSVMNDTGF